MSAAPLPVVSPRRRTCLSTLHPPASEPKLETTGLVRRSTELRRMITPVVPKPTMSAVPGVVVGTVWKQSDDVRMGQYENLF
jgi:hypothetical protein